MYDALNVLYALDLISKNRNKITYVGNNDKKSMMTSTLREKKLERDQCKEKVLTKFNNLLELMKQVSIKIDNLIEHRHKIIGLAQSSEW